MARPGKENGGTESGLNHWDRRFTAPASGMGTRPRSGAVSRVIMPGQVTDEHAPDLVITLKSIDLVLGLCSWPAILYYVVLNRGKSLALKSMKKKEVSWQH